MFPGNSCDDSVSMGPGTTSVVGSVVAQERDIWVTLENGITEPPTTLLVMGLVQAGQRGAQIRGLESVGRDGGPRSHAYRIGDLCECAHTRCV